MLYNCIQNDVQFKDDETVTVYNSGKCFRLVASEHKSTIPKIRKIGNGKYITCSDNSEHDLKNNPVRSTNRAASKRLFDLVLGVCDPGYAVFITATYATNKEYDDSIAKDHKEFIRLLRRKTGVKNSYITVVEMQERGTPHLHTVLMFPNRIASELSSIKGLVNDTWKFGNVKTKMVYDTERLAHYLTKDYADEKVMNQFPKYKKKYFTSRDLSKTNKFTITGSAANALISANAMNAISQQTIYVKDEETGFFDEIKQYIGVIHEDEPIIEEELDFSLLNNAKG